MSANYEIRGALPVRASFRHAHVRQLTESLANPVDVYFATDAVTHSLVIRVRGALSEDEQQSVEDAIAQFSRKWGAAGAIFSRQRYGEPSFFPLGLASHVDLLDELADLHVQLDALLARQAAILARFGTTELPSATKPVCR
ncbi:hypothetical protein EOS_17540 [Caballeronia mineralivorans PML1(12)]|uniref:Uncharacterized protein n=1 Tax=Caballeronia mineralivorans PML1(12) TaxID=908627 RepID=A0A0J1FY79_9BURK|nr:hypothetical protein [Caballeronia mineralivorans]KLU24903.1 hypothetical protein EOS_17540 [Caballeronia mineralivorans PML1(12)]